MPEERVRRRLAAILAADVVGFSRLMAIDEVGTMAVLKGRRKTILQPLVNRHHGRIIKLMGDGVLIEFGSAVNAVTCAAELQAGMESANRDMPEDRQIVLRVGINLGDVMVEGADLYGDGVNIAARLEGLAEPGGVYISQAVFSHVRGKVRLGFEDLGEMNLKNMSEPVRVYRMSGAVTPAAKVVHGRIGSPSKLSVAVLPFLNMSGDQEQEYFSDGITEDIITDLSKVSTLNVLSRNTAFTFKGASVDVGQIGRQLKVAYVVEGSVRKAGGRVRITAQLIDAKKDSHIWAERYDRDFNDIFALQDEISEAIVSALRVRLLPAERKAIENRSTHDPRAYQLYLLGRHYQVQRGARSLAIALRFYRRALEMDPHYARAWAFVALCEAYLYIGGKSEESGLAAAEKALLLDPTLAEAHAAKGRALAELGRYNEALGAHDESLRLEPDSFDVRHNFGRTCLTLGRHEAAVEHFERAAQLLEADYASLSLAAQSYRSLCRQREALAATQRALERIEKEIALRPDNANAMVHGAIALAYLGEEERAKEWIFRALIIDPDDTDDRYNVACALAQMNEPDQALDLLDSCIPKMSAEVVNWMKQDIDLQPLHGDARYQAMIERAEARLVANQLEQPAKTG